MKEAAPAETHLQLVCRIPGTFHPWASDRDASVVFTEELVWNGFQNSFITGTQSLLSASNGIQLVFQAGGKVVVYVRGEVVRQELDDHAADVSRVESVFFSSVTYSRACRVEMMVA